MHEIINKYLWDGKQNISKDFAMRRMIEYASFVDIIKLDFQDIKDYVLHTDINKLRCDNVRKKFFVIIKPYIENSDNWEKTINKLVDFYFKEQKKC